MRIDGRDCSESAGPAQTSGSAHRLRWCGTDEVLTAKSFLLREPMVYYSVKAPSEDEPSCIDLSLEVRSPARPGEPGPSLYPTYALLSPAQRAEYLHWLSKDRTSSLAHTGYAFLFLCGLERRLFLERSRPSRNSERSHSAADGLLVGPRVRPARQSIGDVLTRRLLVR